MPATSITACPPPRSADDRNDHRRSPQPRPSLRRARRRRSTNCPSPGDHRQRHRSRYRRPVVRAADVAPPRGEGNAGEGWQGPSITLLSQFRVAQTSRFWRCLRIARHTWQTAPCVRHPDVSGVPRKLFASGSKLLTILPRTAADSCSLHVRRGRRNHGHSA